LETKSKLETPHVYMTKEQRG